MPLFLNNYPSLGGGGAPVENGLAIRWGHVFTVPGIWVARTVLHVARPNPASFAGDNGDFGEEFGRLLLAIVVAAIVALAWTVADRKRPRASWVEPSLHLLLRYSIILGLASYAWAKIVPQQFPPLSGVSLEMKVGELAPASLLWSFMQYSRPYSLLGGVMELGAILLLCFRRTTTLGALLCLVVMTNVMALNFMYDVAVKLYSTMFVLSAAVLALYDAPRLFAVFVRNTATTETTISLPILDRTPGALRWTVKIGLVASVLVSSAVTMASINGHSAAPFEGAWRVTSFAGASRTPDPTEASTRWRRFAADDYLVAIRLESDSLLTCRRTPPESPNVLRFSCRGNRQGELRWTRTGDTLALEGTFDGAPMTASASNLKRSDYRLVSSKPRLIRDR
ncbi:MAG TPA: hypothetical protein VLN49_23115 [Gemmatimonadaceae bacterium]|nr:hypothetical protein [Gemmatimonadaceae bacterium]